MRSAREAVGASASSVFLLDRTGRSLSGLAHEWDWTRTSFAADVNAWPTVARALASGSALAIRARDARGAERDWFGARGIECSVCVPLRHEGTSTGVLFFDFAGDAPRAGDHLEHLAKIARRCDRAFTRGAATITWLH